MSENLASPKNIISYQLENFLAQIFHFEQIDSTNTFLKKYFHSQPACLEGVGALADLQTAGRGRLERVWYSAKGEGFYFSILLIPNPNNISLISLMTAVATAEAIMVISPVTIDIKWPNDILINKRKVAGILIESAFEGNNLSYVIIGIGINLQQKNFPSDLNRPATSLFLETNLLVESNKLLPILLEKLDYWYKILKTKSDKIIERWQELSSFAYGKRIKVNINNQDLVCTTKGLNDLGALRVETSEGKEIVLYGNEITSEG